MAWIESHQELRHHYKTKRLARELKVTTAAAVGHLHFLWWWAVDFAPDGDLSKFDDYEIADAIGYEGKDASKAKAALISAGFLDNTEQGLLIHDWNEYAGRTLVQREKTRTAGRERQKRYREQQSAHNNALQPKTETQNPSENGIPTTDSNALVTRYTSVTDNTDNALAVSYSNTPVTPCNAPTVHNITEHNNTVHNITDTTPPLPPASGGMRECESPSSTESVKDARFEAFWSAYPKKQGKGAAIRAWNKIKPNKQLFEQILSAVNDNIAHNGQWKRDNGQYIPNPATWLNQQRWLDELPPQQHTGGAGYGTGTERQHDYTDFEPSAGFRSADTDADANS